MAVNDDEGLRVPFLADCKAAAWFGCIGHPRTYLTIQLGDMDDQSLIPWATMHIKSEPEGSYILI